MTRRPSAQAVGCVLAGMAAVAAVVLTVVVEGSLTRTGDGPATAGPQEPVAVSGDSTRVDLSGRRSTGTALGVLRRWDLARAAAYSAGDSAALRRLYVPGSQAGRRDVRILRTYDARGLAVRGLLMQRLRAKAIELGPDRVRLRVVERLAGGTVVGRRSSVALPTDGPALRTVVLVLLPGGWRVESVR